MKNLHLTYLIKSIFLIVCAAGSLGLVNAQKLNIDQLGLQDSPANPTPYELPASDDVKAAIERVHAYLESVTPLVLIDKNSKENVSDFKDISKNTIWEKGDTRYKDYTTRYLGFIIDLAEFYNENPDLDVNKHSPVHTVIKPGKLDHTGAMSAAMIKSIKYFEDQNNYDPVIENFINHIYHKQYRLTDGTLARNVPHPNTLWLDDMFMSIPALAQMGKYTGKSEYFDDAVKQVIQFSKRMYNHEQDLYMHGWVEQMDVHPQFHWARANGWAVMAMVELLDVLPTAHSGYTDVVKQLQSHVKGLAHYQDGTGFWHQLLDRNDTYLETSATAIFTYCITRAINLGLIDPYAYAPVVILGWNAVATKINDIGQVEGTCIGTGMGFDPSFYYYRDVDVLAAHGYGPVILAGSEIMKLFQSKKIEVFDDAFHYNIDPKYRF